MGPPYYCLMAATINATLKSATANSFVTLLEADAYFETVPSSTQWDNKQDDNKNRALISATGWINTLNFYGDRCDSSQSLSWPRNNYHVDRVELACSAIPDAIKKATYLLAFELANDTDAITGNTGDKGLYEEVELGDLKVKYNTASQATGTVNNVFDVYPWLQSYLGAYCLGGSGSYQVRMVRG